MLTLRSPRKFQKLFLILTACLLLASFAGLFLHHHADGGDSDCKVCFWVKTLRTVFFAAILMLAGRILKQGTLPYSFQKISSLLFPSQIQERAPPVLLF